MATYFTQKEFSKITSYKGGITIDHSLIYRYIVSPFCAKLVTIIPSWLAPNVLTMFGLLCNIVAYFLVLAYCPTMTEDAPRWVYLAAALLILSYVIADNSDGKQAVRTGSSSPLGELLDHGSDSCVIAMGALTTAAIIQGGPWVPLLFAGPGMVAFYLAHWQEYFNHYLECGMFNGPTEAESFVILLYLITFVKGPLFWNTPFTVGSYALVPNDILKYGLAIMLVYTIVESVYTGSKLARRNKISFVVAYSQLIPFLTCFGAGALWIYCSPSLYLMHPHLFLITANLVFGYLVCECIIQRMCELPYKYFYRVTSPYLLAALNSIASRAIGIPLINEEYVLYIIWGVYMVIFMHFASSVVQGLCAELKIKAWTIPYPNKGTPPSEVNDQQQQQ